MIYLDYNGSTPMDPQVAELVASASAHFANPSSVQHHYGQAAAEIIEGSRHRVAHLAGRPARDVIFTSGASEAAAIGIIGTILSDPDRPNVVVAATEHLAILQAAATGARLARGEVRVASVDGNGQLDLQHFQDLLDGTVGLAIVMAANNETGVIHQTGQVGELVQRAGARWFCDITQLVGKGELGPVQSADLIAFSSHKIYGPKGAGALLADRHLQKVLVPILPGGGQEHGLRGGTQNTAGIAGFGLAAELAEKEQPEDAARLANLAATLLDLLRSRGDEVIVNSGRADRLSNTMNLRFADADADAVMASMPEVAVSTGSACHAGATTQSHVLTAMGLSDTEASQSLRISLGRPTSESEIRFAATQLSEAVSRVRMLA